MSSTRTVRLLFQRRPQEQTRSWQRASDTVDRVGGEDPQEPADALTDGEHTFRRLLVNSLVSGVTSSFLWFALTFWVYLETRSVVVTGVIAGAFSISSAVLGPAFGTYVDRHRKQPSMVLATTISTVAFAAATVVFLAVDADDLLQPAQPVVLAADRAHPARLRGRPDAQHRHVDVRDAARARRPPRPGQRPRRHRHRRLVRHHVGVQRAGHRPARHGLGAVRVARADRRRARPPPPHPRRGARAGPGRRRLRPAASTSAAPSRRSTPCPG